MDGSFFCLRRSFSHGEGLFHNFVERGNMIFGHGFQRWARSIQPCIFAFSQFVVGKQLDWRRRQLAFDKTDRGLDRRGGIVETGN